VQNPIYFFVPCPQKLRAVLSILASQSPEVRGGPY
jgi:hypothetical protein